VPQGSKIAAGNGRLRESSRNLPQWRYAVTAAAAGLPPLIDGPVAMHIVFTVLRPARPKWSGPATRPDLDKLARAVLDGITDAGLWADDGRVTEFARLAKVWPDADPDALPCAGVIVAAAVMTQSDWPDLLADLYTDALAAGHYARRQA
jgi:crossover junction endodeoxyribonuclease RusA